ncbi:MAG: nickel-dependent lactate racemase [Methanobacteriota archaeon]|nr:MAG: nickel-dependent lactate racemase [Euryarchaeota archaeon]
MRIDVAYGDKKETVEVPDHKVGEIVLPNELPSMDEASVIRHALANPLGSVGLSEFLEGARSVLVIVNDATRPTPTARIMGEIHASLRDLDAKYIVATGMHAAPTEEEYRFIFGDAYDDISSKVISHDSKESTMVRLGRTSRGTEVRMNSIIQEVDRIVVIGSVEPHYFAGYTGGRKAFIPGISAYETIEQNHKLALSLDAQALRLDGNPVHEDMMEAMRFLTDKDVFSIMAVLDRDHKTCAAFSGGLRESFDAAVEKADKVFVVPLKGKAEIVVAVTSFPHDIDLYQSQKALDNAKYAVKEGGIVILVSACRKGVGPDTFLKLLASAETPGQALEKIAEGYKLGYHKAAKMAEIGLDRKLYAVTTLDAETARKAHLIPMASVQEALDSAMKEMDEDAKVTFIMDAVITVPKIEPC